MRYPAKFTPAKEGGYVVTFRDIPEAITQGDTKEEPMEMATDALLSALEFYFPYSRPIPFPSEPKRRERLVELPPSVEAKALLLNEMLAQRVYQAELARRLKKRPQDIQRLVDIRHTTKIDTIAEALRVIGKRLEIKIA